jgi:DNA repair exonuclease SbcCD nuclease subunit
MIRYLAIPDLSATPSRMPILRETVFPSILRAARKHCVDFALFPGDVHDTNFYLSNEYNAVLDFFAELMTICPVAGVCGTPGHETPDMYGALERIGFVLMRPGKVYGFQRVLHRIICENDYPGNAAKSDCILFGIPELIPSRIQSELGYLSIADYVREYVAPMRLQFSQLPAIGVLHGTVSDCTQENELDPKRKSASAYIRTDDLSITDCTRWELGHIHTPWESKKISAGYAGSWGEDYGCLGFVPAMNLVEIDNGVSITRIAYGTPARMKIDKPLPVYSPDIAYWLHTSDLTIEAIGGHPWNRVTHEPQRVETRRVTADQASGAALPDLFKLIDPTVDATTLDLVRTLGDTQSIAQRGGLSISVNRVDIEGCVFWGKPITLILDQLPSGLTQIMGANGEGKSSLAAFCTPYPIVVGKDTRSGRPSAIKDFFDSPDSRISKKLTVNGIEHNHLIVIKGAHTQTPKVECYLMIDGVPQLDKGTFDEMLAKCEELYGSYSDYLLTTFYVQPLQGKTGSSLMSATMTDIRDLVQAIAGIDREAQKREALDRVASYEKQLTEKEAWLKGAEANRIDVDAIERQIVDLDFSIKEKEISIRDTVKFGTDKKSELATLIDKQKAEHEVWLKQETVRQEAINRNKERANIYQSAVNDYNRRLAEVQLKIKTENNRADNAYHTALSLYNSRKSEYQTTINNSNCPCENCGKIPYANIEKRLLHAQTELSKLIPPIKPELSTIPIRLDESLPVRELPEVVPDLVMNDTGIDAKITTCETELEELRTQHRELSAELARLEAQAIALQQQIEQEQTREIERKTIRDLIPQLTDTLGRWKYIAVMLQPGKIPAMELDMVLDLIDHEATRNIEPYREGAYSFSTRTQRQGKQSVIDAFDIRIHDNSTGIDRSFIEFSPGVKAFLNDAYVKALIRIRNQRNRITYSPVISDEADSPIQPESVADYYAMQSRYYDGQNVRVLVVSHAPDARNYIGNQIAVRDLIRREG